MSIVQSTSECLHCQPIESPSQKSSSAPWIVAGTCAGVTLSLAGLLIPFLSPALRRYCLPYVPATDKQLSNVLALLQKHATQSNGTAVHRVVDLGSGDGRVVMAVAQMWQAQNKTHASSHTSRIVCGVELNYPLVLYSRWKAAQFAWQHWRTSATKIAFHRANLWRYSLAPYDCIIIFGVESMMPALRDKLSTEVQEGALVIACRFPFKTWPILDEIKDDVDSVWCYRVHRDSGDNPTSLHNK